MENHQRSIDLLEDVAELEHHLLWIEVNIEDQSVIVGTMINVGLGKLKSEDLHRIIASKNRREAGYSVPAYGLYLTKIVYPNNIKLKV